jgi:hypothetical protein
MIYRYEHHGQVVAVQDHLRGRHREHCLCFSGCAKFKPGSPDNCPIASELYLLCVAHNLTTPVWECPRYEEAP